MANSAVTPTAFYSPFGGTDTDLTMKGQKKYASGTTYNSGINPTVTGTNWTTAYAYYRPYQMSDGTWYLRFNIGGGFSSPVSSATLTVTGITTPSITQALSLVTSSPTVASQAQSDGGAATISLNAASSVSNWRMAGDIELASKPTWAY